MATLLAVGMGAGVPAGIWVYAGAPVERDVYFHLAIARDYASSPFAYFPRLAEGVLAHYPADREPLFHLALAGLLRLGLPDLTAALVLCAVLGGAIGAILYGHSRSLLVVMIGVLGTSTSLFRLLMCRPQLLAIACVLLGTSLLLRGRYRLAALVNLVHGLSYSVPVLLLVAACLCSLQTRTVRGLLWMASASALGLVIHPHFPSNLFVLWYQGYHVVSNALLGNPMGVPIPGELLPWSLDRFLIDAWLPLAIFVVGALRRTGPWWLVAFQLLLLALTLRSMRFVEYWVPLVALSAGPAVRYLVPQRSPLARWTVLLTFLVACPLLSLRDTGLAASMAAATHTIYAPAGEWLRERARGLYVFNAEWDSYPELRYFGGTFSIAQGCDPVLVAASDEKRHRSIQAALDGKLSLEELRKTFGARYLVARRGSLLLRFQGTDGVSLAYEDAQVVVLRIP